MFRPTVVQLEGVDGKVYTLTSESFSGPAVYLYTTPKGLDAPKFDVVVDEYPAIDGGFHRFSRAPVREIFLPLKVVGSTRAQMLQMKRSLIKSLNPKKGPVTIQVVEYDDSGVAGTPRVLSCYYVNGMEGGEGDDGYLSWSTYGVVLRATNPYFRYRNRMFANFLDTVTVPFLDPETPFLSLDGETPGGGLRLSKNPEWVNDVIINNPGDVEAQPRWEIRGPLSAPISLVKLNDEGVPVEELRLSQPVQLAEDQVLVIETEPGGQFIRRYLAQETGFEYDPLDGESFWWVHDITSPMWALDPGENRVGIRVHKPADLDPEDESEWEAANRPTVTVSFYPTFMGI